MSERIVDIQEVHKFSDELKEKSGDIQSSLDKVWESIKTINGMSSFSGKAADEAERYFGEMHGTILESFQGLFDDLHENLEQHLSKFESNVDISDSALIKSNYLEKVKDEIDDVFNDLEKQDEIIHDTIQEVSDIASVKAPVFSDVDEWKKKADKKIKEVDEDLASFTSTSDETDVDEIMNQIESVMDSATTSKGKARFADFEGASKGSDLAKLKDYNEDKEEETLEKAEDAKDSAIKDLEKTSSKDVVNKAYQEFKDGDIDYDEYTAILDSVKNTSENSDEKTIKENANEEFIEYLKDRGMLEDYLAEHETVAEQEKIKKLGDEAKSFLDTLKTGYENGDLSKEDYEELRSIVIEEGSKETKEGNGKEVLSSVMDKVGEFSQEAVPAVSAQLMEMYGKLLDQNKGLQLGPKLMNRMKAFTSTLKNSGLGLSAVGATVGYYDDFFNNDKTGGESTAHNGASLLTSVGGGAIGASLAGLVVASGPAGWIGVGVGAVAGFTFEKMYDNNTLGLRDGLDWTGEKLDWAGEKIDDGFSWAGDAISGGLDAINPLS